MKSLQEYLIESLRPAPADNPLLLKKDFELYTSDDIKGSLGEFLKNFNKDGYEKLEKLFGKNGGINIPKGSIIIGVNSFNGYKLINLYTDKCGFLGMPFNYDKYDELHEDERNFEHFDTFEKYDEFFAKYGDDIKNKKDTYKFVK